MISMGDITSSGDPAEPPNVMRSQSSLITFYTTYSV